MNKKAKILVFLSCFFLFWAGMSLEVRAGEEEDYIQNWLSSCDLSSIDKGMDSLFPGMDLDAGELLMMIMEGKVGDALKLLGQRIKEGLAGETGGLRQIFIYILVLGVVSALFSGFSDLFSGQQIAQAGFYFLYLFLMLVLSRVFLQVSQIASETISQAVMFVKLFIPTYFTAVGAAQGAATAVYYYQMMLVLAYLVESFINAALLPFIYTYVLLALLNGLWAEEKLTLLLDFIKKGICMALKVSMGAVTGLSMVQAVIVPVVDRLKISALRRAVSSIPGIGGVAEGVAELVIGSAVLLKNSMGVLLLVLLLGACAIPLFKILVITIVVKLGAAVTGIVSDKRISECTDRVSEGCFLLFRCVFTSVALFLIVIAVVAYTVSG